jgi:acyl-CoA thioesterase-1
MHNVASRRLLRKTAEVDARVNVPTCGSMPDSENLARRTIVCGLTATATMGVTTQAEAAAPIVALLGDSITAGYGLARRDQALPAQLQAELTRVGVAARVVGAGVSGDTTAGGLRRVDRAAPEGTRVCVVALGANDMMNGVAPAKVRANLEGIVRRLKARRITVLLVGMRAAPILDPGYVRAFDAVFPAVAHSEGVALYPFLLDGVAFDARYNQPDRIHPNAAGIRIIAQRLAPLVARTVRAAA